MSLPPLHPEENARLAALQSYQILDTLEEKDFDDLTALAAAICQVPIALISLVDQNRRKIFTCGQHHSNYLYYHQRYGLGKCRR